MATGQDIVVVAATPAQVHNMTKAAPILKGNCSLLSSSHLCLLLCGQCGEMVLALSSLLLPLAVPMDVRPFLTAEVCI